MKSLTQLYMMHILAPYRSESLRQESLESRPLCHEMKNKVEEWDRIGMRFWEVMDWRDPNSQRPSVLIYQVSLIVLEYLNLFTSTEL